MPQTDAQVVETASTGVEKIQKEAERHMKAADKALEKKSKMDEIKTKEEDARSAIRKKEEARSKEVRIKEQTRAVERGEKKKIEDKAIEEARTEGKKKDEAKTKLMEQQLKKAREESETDAKKDAADEAKDKTHESKKKKEERDESKSKAKAAAALEAAAAERKKKQQAAFEAEVKADKKKEEEEEKEQKSELQIELERKKTDISEKGDKAYNNELSLETKQKEDVRLKTMEAEKVEKKKERGDKADLVAEAEQKMAEVQTKSDEREQKINKGASDANMAKEGASKAAQNEKAKKAKTANLEEIMKRREINVSAIKFQAENAQKDVIRAFKETEKKEADRNKKMMDSKLSEIISKYQEDQKAWKKSLTVREMSGKMSREKAEKASRIAETQLKNLNIAKKDAARKLVEARKARAEVDYIHAKQADKDAKVATTMAASKESELKVEVTTANAKESELRKDTKGNVDKEKNSLTIEEQEKNKAEEFMETHHESREKNVELAEQKVQKWVSSDWKIDDKLKKMQAWSEAQDEANNKKIANEMKSKKKVRTMQSGFERAKKKKAEIQEKEAMNVQFKEMLRKDDEKEKQDAVKRMNQEKEMVQKDEDRHERSEEKTEKADEIDSKALLKEKEAAEKTSEMGNKMKNTKTAQAKAVGAEAMSKKEYEGQQKMEINIAEQLADAKSKYHKYKRMMTRKDVSKDEQSSITIKLKDASAKLSQTLAEREGFLSKLNEYKADVTEKSTKADELNKHTNAVDNNFEQRTKSEKKAKHVVVKDQEKKGKQELRAQADAHKLEEQKAAAKHEARKAARAVEKGAKDVQAGRDKDEREKKQEKFEARKMKERMGKKGDAQVEALRAASAAKAAAKEAQVAATTLAGTIADHTKWKETLKARQETEMVDRELEMKTVPRNILMQEQKKFRKSSAKALKVQDTSKGSYESSKGAWEAAEQKVKAMGQKERMLKDEKKNLVKSLSEAVRTEYKTGKTLKKQRAQMDADSRNAGRMQLKLDGQEKNEIEKKAEKEEAETKEKQASKEQADEKEATSNKLASIDKAEQAASADEQEQEMKADVSTGEKQVAAQNAVKADESQEDSLEKDKAAVSKESAEKEGALNDSKESGEKKQSKASSAMKEARSKRDETKAYLENEKESKKNNEATMKQDEKTTTSNVRNLRHKEMKTKHAEIEIQATLQETGSKEQELLEIKMASAHKFRVAKEAHKKVSLKFAMAGKILEKMTDENEANESKESATKTMLSHDEATLKATRENSEKVSEAANKAFLAKKEAQNHARHASEVLETAASAEKDSKNNALERTKKMEASAIQRAVEKKNKAGEQESKAYEVQAEQRKKQYMRAKSHRTAIIKSLDKFIKAKDVLTEKYALSDLFAVKKMESKNEQLVSVAENNEKHAVKNAAETSDSQTNTATKSQEQQVKLDKAKAILKKASDLYDARQRSRESAKKSQAIAVKESAKKATQKAFLHADVQSKKALQKMNEAQYTVRSKQAMADKASNLEKAAREAAGSAAQTQLKATNKAAAAKQSQESGSKISDRFRTLSTMISEREQKRKSATVAVQNDEKTYKTADDEFRESAANCEKAKAANQNIGKAYNKLKLEMKQWSMQNPWLKQDEDPTSEEMGESQEDQMVDQEAVDSATDVVAEDALEGGDDGSEMPEWGRRSFTTLLQEDYGTDVTPYLQ